MADRDVWAESVYIKKHIVGCMEERVFWACRGEGEERIPLAISSLYLPIGAVWQKKRRKKKDVEKFREGVGNNYNAHTAYRTGR